MHGLPRPSTTTSSPSLLLDAYLQALDHAKSGRRALHLRLSGLKPYNRREHHRRAATDGFNALVDAGHGQLFKLANADLLFFYTADLHPRVEAEARKVCFLFSDDSLLRETHDRSRFLTWFDVEQEFEVILQLSRSIATGNGASSSPPSASARTATPAAPSAPAPGDTLTPELLGRIETGLARANLASLLRRRTVCAVSPGNPVRTEYVELYLSIPDLAKTLLPGIDLMSSRSLFRHLTETLDRRMLAILAGPEPAAAHHTIGINLNVATVLSAAFLAFDDIIRNRELGPIVVELDHADVCENAEGYVVARKLLRTKGYRICLDGLSPEGLELVDLARLDVDLAKIIWDRRLADAGEEAGSRLRAAISPAGETRIVLGRVDTPQAVMLGQSAGIELFQGHYVERIVGEDKRWRQLLRLNTSAESGT